jgi:integrase
MNMSSRLHGFGLALRRITTADLERCAFGCADASFGCRAETAKNKKEEPVGLVPEIVAALRGYCAAHESPSKLVFPNGIPRASQLRKDEKANGIAYRAGLGRHADFHALRHTRATFLKRYGISQRFAMKRMRHSDIRLTAKVYSDETQLPVYEAIKNLPWRQKKSVYKYAHRFQSQRVKTGRKPARLAKG